MTSCQDILGVIIINVTFLTINETYIASEKK